MKPWYNYYVLSITGLNSNVKYTPTKGSPHKEIDAGVAILRVFAGALVSPTATKLVLELKPQQFFDVISTLMTSLFLPSVCFMFI